MTQETETRRQIEALYQRIRKIELGAMTLRQDFQLLQLNDISDRNNGEMLRISLDLDLIARISNNTNERLRLIVHDTNAKAKAEVGQ